ncbi:hypothetical protein CHS0354_025513 [Potamilus streckersoni]|uniref:Uncharacterized protein n=1 Tax=Potamilus streckersoni TaxID=2493646 RepID=A0AAE0SKX1_9BIVA|nr:hypothetical protein CHS0354_025513 [Potamilus streckersoni]
MSIVLPSKRKFYRLAPSESVQNARARLGPQFSDEKLFDFSRNDLELVKLLQELDKLDKARYKLLRDIRREQAFLFHTLRGRILKPKEESKTSITSLGLYNEEIDGEQLPAGFRYHSNGQPKLPSVSRIIESRNNLLLRLESRVSAGSLAKLSSKRSETEEHSTHEEPDYRRVSKELEITLNEIREEIAKYKITQRGSVYAGDKKHDFLKARSKLLDKPYFPDFTTQTVSSPNDRFAAQTGFSRRMNAKNNLHKQTIYSPAKRVCVGCLCRLKHKSDDFARLQENRDKTYRRRWSISPPEKKMPSTQSEPGISTLNIVRKSSTQRKYDKESSISSSMTMSYPNVKQDQSSIISLKRPVSDPNSKIKPAFFNRSVSDTKPLQGDRDRLVTWATKIGFSAPNVSNARASKNMLKSTRSDPLNYVTRSINSFLLRDSLQQRIKDKEVEDAKKLEIKIKDFLKRCNQK